MFCTLRGLSAKTTDVCLSLFVDVTMPQAYVLGFSAGVLTVLLGFCAYPFDTPVKWGIGTRAARVRVRVVSVEELSGLSFCHHSDSQGGGVFVCFFFSQCVRAKLFPKSKDPDLLKYIFRGVAKNELVIGTTQAGRQAPCSRFFLSSSSPSPPRSLPL